jgi:hypothetical protein
MLFTAQPRIRFCSVTFAKLPRATRVEKHNSSIGIVIMHGSLAATLVVGLICLFYPQRVQRYALRRCRDWVPGLPNPFIGWMGTAGYVVYLRIMGCLFTVVALGIELLVWKYAVPIN